MADQQALNVCKGLAQCIREARLPVDGLVLFGSMARGDAHEWSDIDLVVLIRDDVDEDEFHEVRRAVYRLAMELDTRLELLPLYVSQYANDDATPIIEIARTQGIRIAA